VESPSPTQSPTRPRTAASRAAAILWLILILATLYACYFTHLDAVGLVGPDEPRYAWIARDMAESGDFITPRLYGKPWFEKPPLYYWSAAVSFKLFGVSETSARLPSAIFALLATLAAGWLAWRIYSAESACWLLLMLPTSVGMIGFSHAAATDMPFAATLTLGMVAAAILLGLRPESQSASEGPSSHAPLPPPRVLASLLFGFFLALATLAKGPAALILTGGATALRAFFTKRWGDAVRLLHPAAIAAFCATAFPWYILCAIRNPDFLRVFIIEHNFKRFLTPEFQHVQPFWFYAEILLLAFLPWIAALLWAFVTGLNRARTGKLSAPTIFLLCWALFCIGFFTISRSKLPGYILPAMPPIAILLARSCTFTEQKHQRRWLAFASLIVALLSAVVFISLWNHPDRYLKHSSAFAPLFYLALFMLTFTNLFFALGFFFSRRTAAWTAIVPILTAFYVFDTFSPFTPLSVQSPRYMAQQIVAEQIPLSALRAAKIKRATLYGLNFYLRADIQEWDGDASREVYVLTPELTPPTCVQQQREASCANLWDEPEKIGDLELQHLKPR
jgi:4-amino-4-deoxy-L-arabinose transferase-like glycosyltransferase